MDTKVPESLILVAGRDAYPQMLAKAARNSGVQKIVAIAFKGETRPTISKLVDEVRWVNLGNMQVFLDTLKEAGIKQLVMVGQLAPMNLFTLRMDKLAREMYQLLEVRNAHTIFGSIAEKIETLGIDVLPGNSFMDEYTPATGVLSKRSPNERERADIDLGLRLVKGTSEFEIGQTVVVKEGVIIAVEAFEGTNKTIRRAGQVGGSGSVVVKVPKQGHDMRFDIPVVGTKTFAVMKRAGISCLAVEAGKTILLEKEKLIALADQLDMAFVAINTGDEPQRLKEHEESQ